MTIGVGGSDAKIELALLKDMTAGVIAISTEDYAKRIEKAQSIMAKKGIEATYLNAGANLYYFTGTKWGGSERIECRQPDHGWIVSEGRFAASWNL